jgi:hypothetical protein
MACAANCQANRATPSAHWHALASHPSYQPGADLPQSYSDDHGRTAAFMIVTKPLSLLFRSEMSLGAGHQVRPQRARVNAEQRGQVLGVRNNGDSTRYAIVEHYP